MARAFITWQDAYALLYLPLWASLFDRAEERARARSGRVRPRKEPRKPSLKLAEPEVRNQWLPEHECEHVQNIQVLSVNSLNVTGGDSILKALVHRKTFK